MTKSGELSRRWYSLRPQFGDVLPHRGDVRREITPPLLLRVGRGVTHEGRERDFRVDDDVLLLGQVQHHVGPQVAPLLVLDVVLRLVVDALREGRTVEDRFEQHLAPVALHLRIAFQGVGQVPGLGGDRLVEFHQAFEFRFQLAPLGGLRGVDLLDALAEVDDVLLERFQKDVDRLPAGLLEPLRLLAQNLRREVFELQAETLFELFAFGFLGGALLGVLLFQAGDFRLGRGAQGGQFGFGAQPRFDLHADVRFGLQAGLLGGGLVGTQVAGFAAGGGEHGPERRREGAEHDDCKNECGVHTDKGRIFRGIFRIFDRQTL